MAMNLELVVIDPQKDFCTSKLSNGKPGALYVPGAEDDITRLAKFVTRLGKKIKDIHTTLDSHHLVDIAHPIFWVNGEGQHPNPFTLISKGDVEQGVWRATNPGFQERGLAYVTTLEANGRYPLCIWPAHCLIGSEGGIVVPELFEAFLKWEEDFKMVDYVTKGSNFWTEHYSAVQADVPDPEDPGTMLNTKLIETLQRADIVVIAGQALSHCVANTITDIADNFGDDNIKKMVLLEDCSSNVPTFEQMGKDFIIKMKARGMQVSNSIDFLK